ncbi:thioredoxin family protein [Nocardia sp. NPDC049149]|uniref:thioredoxin family protein n=1 Tax=Nocardia sp. NPDC049149 TaxID=3364315 RepID=UPI0037112D5E
MSSDLIVHVSDSTFEETVLKADHPVLVVFWAEWSAESKAIAPALGNIATAYQGRVTVAKLNIDENQETPARLGVRTIPVLMLFMDGNVKDSKIGNLSESRIAAFLDTYI